MAVAFLRSAWPWAAEHLPSFLAKFLSHVQIVDDADSCWPWQANRDSDGYGYCSLVYDDLAFFKAHRISLFLASGAVKDIRNVVRHSCDNPPCVRPKHLLEGTHQDNARDRDSRGRAAWQNGNAGWQIDPNWNSWLIGGRHAPKGEAHYKATLTELRVRCIRAMHRRGYGYRRLSVIFSVPRGTVRCVVTRKNWKRVRW